MSDTIEQKNPVGRPTLFTEDVIEQFCDMLVCGMGVNQICEAMGIAESTFYRKLWRDPHFASLIAQAREIQQEYEVDHMVEMADKATTEDWQVQKLRIWIRQWRAAHLAPKKFTDQGTNININNNVVIAELSDDDQKIENAKQIAFALYSAQKLMEQKK